MHSYYFRKEYSDKQWAALLDKAVELGCQVDYCDDHVIIDSTEIENTLLQSTNLARSYWGEYIHDMLQESTNLRKWKVQPKKQHSDFKPIIYETKKSAEHNRKCLEKITGFKWETIEIPE